MNIDKRTFILIFGFSCFGLVSLLGYTGRDDSHISYFVSDMWASNFTIQNYNGQLLEQSTTLLYSILLGTVVLISGLPASTLAPFVSFLFLLATLLICWNYLFRIDAKRLPLVAIFSMPLFYWSLSGMENSLYVFLLFSLYASIAQYYLNIKKKISHLYLTFIGILAILLPLVRPEFFFISFLLISIFALFLLKEYALSFKYFAPTVTIPIGTILAMLVRLQAGLGYFPNTVTAKQSGGNFIDQAKDGVAYFAKVFYQLPFSSSIALIGFLLLLWRSFQVKSQNERTSLQFGMALTFSLFVFALAAGGDWMEAGRFLVAPMFFATFLGLQILDPRRQIFFLISFLAGFTFDAFRISSNPYGGFPLYYHHDIEVKNFHPSPLEGLNAIHSRDISFIDKMIPVLSDVALVNSEPVNVASIQAGMVPYYLKIALGDSINFIDLFGLSTSHVHNCRGNIGWGYDPYDDIASLQECIGVNFDFVYDLDGADWKRLNHLLSHGCVEVFSEVLVVGPPFRWREQLSSRLFLVDCRNTAEQPHLTGPSL